tara:strand:+ start:197 stop:643 length:447 start_codon:yes stop_codon:yes gene_type:complete
MDTEFFVHKLERHQTKDTIDSHVNGELTVLWRDWDKIINDPKMVYVNVIDSNQIKGPHLHKNRTSYFYCLDGEMVIVIQDKKNNYHEIKINSKEPSLIQVSNGVGAALVNPSEKIVKVLVLADIAWHPDENEMLNIKFENYDWNKWKK